MASAIRTGSWRRRSRRSASRLRASARSPGSDLRVVDVAEHVFAPAFEPRRDETRVDDPGDRDDSRGIAQRFVQTREGRALFGGREDGGEELRSLEAGEGGNVCKQSFGC